MTGGRAMLGLVKRLALVALTFVVTAYFASPAPLALVFDAVTGASAERGVSSFDSRHWQEADDASQIVELKVVESDGDDDKDPGRDVAEGAELAFRLISVPSKPDRVLRGEIQVDPSCFAAGTGLPRGPPV